MDASSIDTPPGKRKPRIRFCTVDGCERVVQARGLCIRHYNGFYNSGAFTRVARIVGTPEERFHQSYRVDEVTGCWVWTEWTNDKGYAMLALPGDRKVRASRFAYTVKYGEIPSGMKVLHRCDNPPCVNWDHLFLGTTKDNARDMVAKGRQWSKPGRERVKLTWQKVGTIRVLYARGGYSCGVLATIYGVSEETIRKIVKGEAWVAPPVDLG